LLLFIFGCSLGLPLLRADTTQTAQQNSSERTVIDNMQTIMLLLRNHQKIAFSVKLVHGGVRTTNTCEDPVVAKAIRQHAADMKLRNEEGINVRPADPLFQELIRRHKEIKIRLVNIPDGVIEYETSSNPQVTLLIRAHTKTVSEFVRYGLPRAQEPSPLPKGYIGD